MGTVRQPLATQAELDTESGLRASGDDALVDLVALEAAARAAADNLRALLTDPRFTDARPPTGGAGGVLSGGYPDPGFAVDMAEQSELQTEITNRAADVDAEEAARIAGDALLVPLTQKGSANGVATLDAAALVPVSQLPALAINDTFVVASQAAMLALTAQRGDVAIRTDLTKTFILSTDSPGTLADWKEILFPTDAVSSVDGRTGTVTLSDLYAPFSETAARVADVDAEETARISADALKAPIASPTFTGTVTLPGDPGSALVAAPKQYVDAQAAAAQAASQPSDSDLTAIAALATTAYGRAFLALANQAALHALIGAPPFVRTDQANTITRGFTQSLGGLAVDGDVVAGWGGIWGTAVGALSASNFGLLVADDGVEAIINGSSFVSLKVQNQTKIRGSVNGVGLNGNVPVAKAAAVAAPTAPGVVYAQAEAASMKTAVDAIRVALQNIGITL